MNNPNDMWEILGVDRDVTQSELKAAWKRKAIEHHPDRGGDPEEFKRAEWAYDCLRKRRLRRERSQPSRRRTVRPVSGWLQVPGHWRFLFGVVRTFHTATLRPSVLFCFTLVFWLVLGAVGSAGVPSLGVLLAWLASIITIGIYCTGAWDQARQRLMTFWQRSSFHHGQLAPTFTEGSVEAVADFPDAEAERKGSIVAWSILFFAWESLPMVVGQSVLYLHAVFFLPPFYLLGLFWSSKAPGKAERLRRFGDVWAVPAYLVSTMCLSGGEMIHEQLSQLGRHATDAEVLNVVISFAAGLYLFAVVPSAVYAYVRSPALHVTRSGDWSCRINVLIVTTLICWSGLQPGATAFESTTEGIIVGLFWGIGPAVVVFGCTRNPCRQKHEPVPEATAQVEQPGQWGAPTHGNWLDHPYLRTFTSSW